MESDVSPAATAENKLDLPRLFLLAAVLPAAIAAVNYALVDRHLHDGALTLRVGGQFAWYVAQVGLVGYAVGHGLSQPVWRWLVFGWILLLIDLLAAAFAMDRENGESALLSAALWSGQMGLCVVWGFLGDTRWTLRWPAMIVAMAALYFLWIGLGNSWGQHIWTELLALQVGTLSLLCGILYASGFRLRIVAATYEQLAGDDGQRRPLQFGIKHVLIWTTALAVVLGIAKGMDLLRWQVAQQLVREGLIWKSTVATMSASAIVVALWAAVGRGHCLLRYPLGLIFVASIGTGLSLWSLRNATATTAMIWSSWTAETWQLFQWYRIGWWWLAWTFLSGGLLAATLMILRVLGYRLVSVRRLRALSRVIPC